MCKYCGMREHTAVHHEDEFKRAGTTIRAPSNMCPTQLQAEVNRCLREDGTIGLASVCTPCHHQAERKSVYLTPKNHLRSIARNRKLDSAAKLARRECECDDERCHRPVTAEDVEMFEWDHLVQSFDDPGYHKVSALVTSGKSAARCDEERAKCRLLYITCHRLHSALQRHRHDAQGDITMTCALTP
jgi:hypothetical protein